MEWLSQNWFFVVLLIAFAAMHMVGHGGHGGHRGHGGHGNRPEPRSDEPGGYREAGSGGTNAPDAGTQSRHDHGASR